MTGLPATTRETLCALISRREDWLMARILDYAKDHGYTAYTSTLLEAWRASIHGLSRPLIDFLRDARDPELSAEQDFASDPAASFGIEEARKHRSRGVPLAMFLGLMKYYRAAYLDLLADGMPEAPQAAHHLIHRFFDRVEVGFCGEWDRTDATAAAQEMAETNRRLANEKNRYLTCFESLDEAVVLTDAAGHIVNVNLAASRLFFGRTQSGAYYYDDAHPEDWRHAALEELAEAPGEVDQEQWLETAFGTHLFRVRKRPMLDVSDKFTGSVVVLRDITSQHRMDQALQDAKQSLETHLDRRTRGLRATIDRLTQSNADLERFAYIASHDLQEPLRMVASYTQLLARRYGDLLDEDGRTYVKFAVEGAQRMHDLIEDLLAYSRVNTRGAEPVVCDSGQCLIQALHDLGHILGAGQARIAVGTMPPVLADRVQLIQVLQNLTGNAVKFRHPDRPASVSIGAERVGNRWRFTVSDNGIGIPPEDRERAFALFQRLHGRESYGGTGIGLAVCKRIVERHGGAISLSETPGGGTTVTFDFAVTAEDRAPAPPEAAMADAPSYAPTCSQ